MIIFFVILFLLFLLNLLWWWQADALLRQRKAGWRLRIWPAFLAGGMGILLAVFILSRGVDFSIRDHLPLPLLVALYLWFLVVLPVWLVLSPAIGIASLLGRRAELRKEGGSTASSQGDWDRRSFLAYSVTAVPAALLVGTTTISIPQLRRFRIRHYEVPVASLPSALEGLTIAQVSDVHVGAFTSGEILQRIVRATNELKADLVLLTGDLINDNLNDLPEAVEMVRAMEARHGVFLCEGNHDLIPGPYGFELGMREAGLNLLVNEQQTLRIRGEPVQILGLRWGRGKGRLNRADDYSEDAIAGSLAELLEQRNPEAFPILMAHHPHAFDPAAEAGLPLTLAGHTHGGQLMVNEDLGFGPAMYRYWTGLYQKSGSTLSVSNGVGNWFPLRTAAPAEIIHLTLRRRIS